MLQIVIPVHHHGGREHTNLELRYALRSWERSMTDPFQVTIVSRVLPDWLHGVRHIRQTPVEGLKSALKSAADAYPDGFIWTYDDTFVVRPTSADEVKIPVARPAFSLKTPTPWSRMLVTVYERLVSQGIPPLDVSRPHCPYWFDKSMVDDGFADWLKVSSKFPLETWMISKRRCQVRFGLEKQYYGAFDEPPGPTHGFVNCNDKGWTKELKTWLREAFPAPSKFEKVKTSKVGMLH